MHTKQRGHSKAAGCLKTENCVRRKPNSSLLASLLTAPSATHLRPGGSASLPLPDGGLTRPLPGGEGWRAAAAAANGEVWPALPAALPLPAGAASAAGCMGGGCDGPHPSSTDSSKERWLVGVPPSVSVCRALSPRRSGSGAWGLAGLVLQTGEEGRRRVGLETRTAHPKFQIQLSHSVPGTGNDAAEYSGGHGSGHLSFRLTARCRAQMADRRACA